MSDGVVRFMFRGCEHEIKVTAVDWLVKAGVAVRVDPKAEKRVEALPTVANAGK